jgi:cytochrome P450
MTHATGDSQVLVARPSLRDPPSVPGDRLLGALRELRRSPMLTYERAMRAYGDVVQLSVGPPGFRFEITAVFHPEGVQHVLTAGEERYSKQTRSYRALAEEIGLGLLTSEGELWRQQRRLIQPLFTPRQVASYASIMAEETAALLDRWPSRGVIDAHLEMIHLTLRVVGRSIFGDDLDEAERVLRWAFPILTVQTQHRAMRLIPLPRSWPTRANRQAERARRAVFGVVDELIARRGRAGGDSDDLLARLLRARHADTHEPMSARQVRDEALIFLLAGHETTAALLTFALHLLGKHPDQQRLIRAEADAVLSGRAPTAERIAALARTEMVLKETARLYPPAYGIPRRARVDDEIGGYRIPAGRIVVVCQWATHRHPGLWPNAEVFDPERFTPEREATRHRYAYFPFGRGPRACIGSHFAMLEAAIALAKILQRYDLCAERQSLELNTSAVTLRPQREVPIEVSERVA